MNNTLEDNSYHVYLKDDYYNINQFDIIIAEIENLHETVIKRVIAGPGDHLQIVDGEVYVNSKYVEQDFSYIPEDIDVDVQLGLDQYYVLGDNRPNSVDSRSFGVVNEEDIIGKVIL